MAGSNSSGIAIIAGVAAALVGVFLWAAREDARQDYEASRAASAAIAAPPTPRGWATDPVGDPMGGAGGLITCTVSTNSLVLPRPYGEVRARLCFRRTERQGFDAMITINPDAIIVCHAGDCPIAVRVDDGALRTYAGADAVSGSPNIVFLENPARLQRALTGSAEARMELTLHDYGAAVFTFDTRDLPPI